MVQHHDEVIYQDTLHSIAEEIAIRSGLLSRCPIHEEVYDSGQYDYESAYKLANYLITKSDPLVSSIRGDRRDLTDKLRDICNNYGDECSFCRRNAIE